MRNEIEKLIELETAVRLAKIFLKDAENKFHAQCGIFLEAVNNEIESSCREYVININGMQYLIAIDSGWPVLDVPPEEAISIRPVRSL